MKETVTLLPSMHSAFLSPSGKDHVISLGKLPLFTIRPGCWMVLSSSNIWETDSSCQRSWFMHDHMTQSNPMVIFWVFMWKFTNKEHCLGFLTIIRHNAVSGNHHMKQKKSRSSRAKWNCVLHCGCCCFFCYRHQWIQVLCQPEFHFFYFCHFI